MWLDHGISLLIVYDLHRLVKSHLDHGLGYLE